VNAHLPSSSVRPLVLLGAALCLVFADVAQGFEAWEHKRISNAAVAIARLEAEEDKSSPLPPQVRDLLRQLSTGAGGLPSYGYLVSLVDFVSRPTDWYVKQGAPPAERRAGIDWPEVSRIRASWLDFLFATKYDELHFGNEALFHADHLHHLAVMMAAGDRDSLVEALAYNAFADHLRQDFLAPGHVIAPKGMTHDGIVKAIHDRYNAVGLDFFLKDKARILSTHAKYLDQSEVKDILDCPAVSRNQATGMLEAGVIPRMRGDGHLWPTSGSRCAGDEVAGQIAFLVLVTADSIGDVLRALRGGGPEMPSTRFWGVASSSQRVPPPEGGASGEKKERSLPAACTRCEKVDVFAACTSEGCFCFPSRLLNKWVVEPFLAPEFGTVALSSNGVYETRLRLQLDALAVLVPPRLTPPVADEERFVRAPLQFLLGPVYEWNGRSRAYGVRLAAVVPIGRLPVQAVLSSEGKAIQPLFDGPNVRDEVRLRFGYQLGLEAGFGFLFVRVGTVRDYRIAEDGKPEVAWGITSTLSMQLPASMFKKR
jgi:hypothetical protein